MASLSPSPFQARWCLYGTVNAHLFADVFHLPRSLANAMSRLRPIEEIHVNADHVHIRTETPEFEIPSVTIEHNAVFGQPTEFPLITSGSSALGALIKESETKWVANLQCAQTGSTTTVTIEIVNGEKWTTTETNGVKLIHKMERTYNKFDVHADKSEQRSSPFCGSWTLYGSENLDQYLQSAGVAPNVRQIVSNMQIHETIHVNGEHVHLRLCIDTISVPAQVQEISYTLEEDHEYTCFVTGTRARTKVTKESDAKWTSTITGFKVGDWSMTREIVNHEMWLTIATANGTMVRKFERCKKHC